MDCSAHRVDSQGHTPVHMIMNKHRYPGQETVIGTSDRRQTSVLRSNMPEDDNYQILKRKPTEASAVNTPESKVCSLL